MDLGIFASLTDRDLRREGLLIGEGRLVAERVASRCRLIAILAERSAAEEAEALAAGRCPVTVLDTEEIRSIAGYPFHRGLLVAAERPPRASLRETPGKGGIAPESRAFTRLVLLPNLTDAENLGAIARSAAALGWDGLVLGEASGDPYGRRALRCSMAATLALPIYTGESAACLELLREDAWEIAVAALEDGAAEPAVLGAVGKLALVLGNERTGIPADWRGGCSFAVAIPQGRLEADGVDSLNVAAAAAILLWEGRESRQR